MKFKILYSNKVSQPNQLSWIIRQIEKLPFSHVCILIDYYGVGWVFEATWPKTRKILFSEWLKEHEIIHELEYETDKTVNECVNFLMPMIGKIYSIAQLFLILIDKIAKGKLSFVKLNGDKMYICSEFCSKFLKFTNNIVFENNEDQIDLQDFEGLRLLNVKTRG